MRLISGSKFTAEKKACPSVDPAGAQLVLKIQTRLVTSRRPAQDSQRPLYDSIYSDLLDIFGNVFATQKSKIKLIWILPVFQKEIKNAPDAAKIWKLEKKQSVKNF